MITLTAIIVGAVVTMFLLGYLFVVGCMFRMVDQEGDESADWFQDAERQR